MCIIEAEYPPGEGKNSTTLHTVLYLQAIHTEHRETVLKMELVGAMMAIPAMQKKMRGKMRDDIILPYEKVVEKATEK